MNREWNRIRIRIEFEFELKFELWINLSCRLWSIVNCLILQCCVELASGWSVTEVESIVLWCGTWLTTWPLRHGKKKLTRRNCPACCVATGITTVGDRALWWQAANCNQTLLRTTCETWRCEVWVCVSVWVCQLSDFARRCFFYFVCRVNFEHFHCHWHKDWFLATSSYGDKVFQRRSLQLVTWRHVEILIMVNMWRCPPLVIWVREEGDWSAGNR